MSTIVNNVAGTGTATSAGVFHVTGALEGFVTLAAGLSNAATYDYKVVPTAGGSAYQTGKGTWATSGSVLTSTSVTTSSNGGLDVDFGADALTVYISADAATLNALSSTTAVESHIADTSDAHALDSITGLTSALAGKAASSHTQAASTITDFDTAVAANSAVTANTAKLTANTANVTAAGALMDSEVSSLSGIKTLTVGDNKTISTFGATLTDDADEATARATLQLGASATKNVGTSAGTVAAGDDARFDYVLLPSMTAASTPDGTELVPGEQSSAAVKLTVQQIAGSPTTNVLGHIKSKRRGYSGFAHISDTASFATGAILDQEPWIASFSGTAASVGSASAVLGLSAALLSTGTDTTGRVALTHLRKTLAFNASYSMDQRFNFYQVSTLPTSQASEIQIGFCAGAVTAAPTEGMYFEGTSASSNWFAVVKNSFTGLSTRVDTGVAMALGSYPSTNVFTFRIWHDPSNSGGAATKFYINDMTTPVATILDSTRIVVAPDMLPMVFSVRKSAGVTAAIFVVQHHSYDVDQYAVSTF